MPTTIEKRQSVIDYNLPGKAQPGTVDQTMAEYSRDVCVDHRTYVKDDDATVTTAAWLSAVGGTGAGPYTWTWGAAGALGLSAAVSGAVTTVTITATDPAETVLGVYSTRGAFRRLATALGITLTGALA